MFKPEEAADIVARYEEYLADTLLNGGSIDEELHNAKMEAWRIVDYRAKADCLERGEG